MIDIEVDLSVSEKPQYHVVGLPDTAIKESGKRVQAAIRNCCFCYPGTGAITVNLAPADFKKEGSCYDLPIALAVMGITGGMEESRLTGLADPGRTLPGRKRQADQGSSACGTQCQKKWIPPGAAARRECTGSLGSPGN